MKYTHIISEATRTPWAILEEKLVVIQNFLKLKAEGGEISAEEIASMKPTKREPEFLAINEALDLEAAAGAAPNGSSRSRAGSVAVLPLQGTIVPKANMMTEMSGGTSCQQFTGWFRTAMKDPNVRAIVVDIDSPGGNVQGVMELADEMYKARGQKPVVAQVSGIAASAAYWLACQCDEIAVTPSGSVGSIGVFLMHQDVSKAAEMEGVKTTFIKAGKYKTEGNPYEPLSDEAQAAMLSRVNEFYDEFVGAVAKGRGTTPGKVKNGFGEGRMVGPSAAVAEGMANRVATMDQTLSRLGVPRQTAIAPKAAGEGPEITATEEQKPAPVVVEETKPEPKPHTTTELDLRLKKLRVQ
jgi:capsid assembly protease